MFGKIKKVMFPPAVREYREEFEKENLKSLVFLIYGGLLVSVVLAVLEFNLEAGFPITLSVMQYLVLFGLLAAIHVNYRVAARGHATMSLYLCEGAVFLCSLVTYAGDHYGRTPHVFLFFLLVLPLLIRDSWGNVLLFEGLTVLVFLVSDALMHPGDVFLADLGYVVIITASVTYLTWRELGERVSSIELSASANRRAEYDVLTGIYNRRGGEDLIRAFINGQMPGAFLIVDVDDFKHINDTYGHAAGDAALRAVAKTLQGVFRETDVVMRMGGDEFIVYAVGMVEVRNAESRLEALREALHKIILDEGTDDHVTASMGCVINLGSYPDYESLSAAADGLLYLVKLEGKDGYKCSDKDYRKKRG